MNSPKGETPQAEITIQKRQDSEHEFPKRGDHADRKNLYKTSSDIPKQVQKPKSTSPDIPQTSPDIPNTNFRVYIGLA